MKNQTMKSIRQIIFAACAAFLQQAFGAGFVDPLDTLAQISPLANRSLMQSVTSAGQRLVAAGQRGRIIVSEDGGRSWTQSPVPVGSDLTAIYFVNDRQGWAVGHDGVILHSADGGSTWMLQLDGRKANELLLAAMQLRAAAEPAATAAQRLLTEAQRYREQGADKPFLDIWFADERTGYAVGAYNLIFRTDDGGTTWLPWFDRTENPKLFNLYAIRPAAGGLYIAGEGGLVLKLDVAAGKFKAATLPYKGSFFGVADAGSAVLVFGLRGNAFRSDDGGRSWTRVAAGLPASIVAGVSIPDGAVVLADAGGRIVASVDAGKTFVPVPLKTLVPLAGIGLAGKGQLALAGLRGVMVVDIALMDRRISNGQR